MCSPSSKQIMQTLRYGLMAVWLLAACGQKATRSMAPSAADPVSTTIRNQPAGAVNTLTEAERAAGWTLLFDGVSTAGWHVYQQKSDGSAWKVSEGTLWLDPGQKRNGRVVGGGDLITDGRYENYHLSLEWKIARNGNSGIIFGIQDQPKYEYSWHTGPEMQVLHNEGHPDGKIRKHRAADLYDLIESNPEAVRPVGEWNRAEIKLNKGKLDFMLNGVSVVSTTLWDEAWKKLVAGSKFRDKPDFAAFRSGHIGLQDHGDTVWYRNIKIRGLE